MRELGKKRVDSLNGSRLVLGLQFLPGPGDGAYEFVNEALSAKAVAISARRNSALAREAMAARTNLRRR
jgi:hypothetical protein